MLYNFKNFFDKNELETLMSFLKSRKSWHFKGNIHQEHLSKSDFEDFNKLFSEVFFSSKNFNQLLSVLYVEFKKDFSPLKEISCCPMRYPDGQSLGIHTDASSYNLDLDDFITFIFYLNSDYSSGNLFYITEDEEIDIDTSEGDMVILTPEVFHGTRVVCGGEKYVVTSLVELAKV